MRFLTLLLLTAIAAQQCSALFFKDANIDMDDLKEKKDSLLEDVKSRIDMDDLKEKKNSLLDDLKSRINMFKSGVKVDTDEIKGKHNDMLDELKGRFDKLIDGCFPRPSGGCTCVTGQDEDGNDITEKRDNDADCKE